MTLTKVKPIPYRRAFWVEGMTPFEAGAYLAGLRSSRETGVACRGMKRAENGRDEAHGSHIKLLSGEPWLLHWDGMWGNSQSKRPAWRPPQPILVREDGGLRLGSQQRWTEGLGVLVEA